MKIKMAKNGVSVKMGKKEFRRLVDLVTFGLTFVETRPIAIKREVKEARRIVGKFENALD